MEFERHKTEQYCEDISVVCSASCSLLKVYTQPKIVYVDSDWFCAGCGGCTVENTLHYGCSEAYRWNGKYVFYCPKGLVFISSPLTDEQGLLCGGMTIGPVVMGELADTLECIDDDSLREQVALLPQWSTAFVQHATRVLFAVASAVSDSPQSLYGNYAYEQEKMLSDLYAMKNEWQQNAEDADFLISSEKQLNSLIVNRDKEGTQKLLNEILGYIFLPARQMFRLSKPV